MRKGFLQMAFLLFMIIIVAGCSTGSQEDETIVFANDSWASNRFFNEIAQFIIER